MYYDISNTPLRVQPKLFQSPLYGVRSNISDPTICNAQYDILVGVFQDNGKQDVLNIEFKTHPFLKQELLSRAHFDIFDLDANKNKQSNTGSPTYIHVIVKAAPIRMKSPFTIFLDSSCPISKLLYPEIKIQIFFD